MPNRLHPNRTEVISVDRYANVPAIQLAHRSYAIDILDGKARAHAREVVTAIQALL
jgi:formate-dependent phosphoribosylglycinamide formyltransferase (GAR transformylase)